MMTTKTYTVEATEDAHRVIGVFLMAMRYLGGWGASRALQIAVDGDGATRVRKVEELEGLGFDRAQFERAIDTHRGIVNLNEFKLIKVEP